MIEQATPPCTLYNLEPPLDDKESSIIHIVYTWRRCGLWPPCLQRANLTLEHMVLSSKEHQSRYTASDHTCQKSVRADIAPIRGQVCLPVSSYHCTYHLNSAQRATRHRLMLRQNHCQQPHLQQGKGLPASCQEASLKRAKKRFYNTKPATGATPPHTTAWPSRTDSCGASPGGQGFPGGPRGGPCWCCLRRESRGPPRRP